jgi:hypothetical protein
MIISRWILLRIRNVSDKSCRENQNTHFMFNNFFPSRKSCRLWDNVGKYGTARQDTDDNIIRRMRFACRITKATDTHSEYVILIAIAWQQWLRERASMLRYRYIDSLVSSQRLLHRTQQPCWPWELGGDIWVNMRRTAGYRKFETFISSSKP